jgi:DNA-binding transcriptional MerR regulator
LVADGRPLSETQDARGSPHPGNVRLGHRLCNPRDFIWRKKINAMLGKRMSLDEIAEKLNVEKVPTIHGTNRWTAASVRKAFVS